MRMLGCDLLACRIPRKNPANGEHADDAAWNVTV